MIMLRIPLTINEFVLAVTLFRLWGDHGQTALESASVCLINATATGTEILKSLVLPGIGSFTIVDGAVISGEDAGNK